MARPHDATYRLPMTALALMMRPIDRGWAVYLTNGQELVRYRGFLSKQLALRYMQSYTRATPVHAFGSRWPTRSSHTK